MDSVHPFSLSLSQKTDGCATEEIVEIDSVDKATVEKIMNDILSQGGACTANTSNISYVAGGKVGCPEWQDVDGSHVLFIDDANTKICAANSSLQTENLVTEVVTQLALGGQHTCALVSNGLVKCWGSASYGQLGSGNSDNLGDEPDEMGNNLPFIDLGPGVTVKQISAGSSYTCAILDNGKVKCWGEGNAGQLGHGSTNHIGDGLN